MSGKQEKKLRQLHRRDFKMKFSDLEKDIYKQLSQIHKPAPRLFPKKLWRALGRIFLNI